MNLNHIFRFDLFCLLLGFQNVEGSNLSEVGFVIGHFMADVVDRVDDFLASCILLGLKWHWSMSVPYKEKDRENISKHVQSTSNPLYSKLTVGSDSLRTLSHSLEL